MKSLRFLDRRAGYSLASLGMLLGIASPAVIPAFASAAQVTSRSIELSNSAAGATNVGYTVKFTTVAAAGAFVLDFCKDSPIYGQTCVAPDDLDVTGVTTATSGFTATKLSNSLIKVASSPDMGAATAQTVVLTGIASNPSTAGDPFYARIVTFDTSANASSYSSTGTNTGKEDDGGVAMSITDSIGVTAAVRESMTFCVSGATLTSGCGGAAAASG